MRRILTKSFGCLTLAFCVFCAKQGFPPGGPVDRTAPAILRTIPAANSLNVFRTTPIEIYFSEKIEVRSLKNAIFISPNPGDRIQTQLKGNHLLLRLLDSLKTNVTYTVTLGTALKDLRGNPLSQSFTLAFSTGDRLDQNAIQGRVFAEQPGEITVWGYFLTSGMEINPSQEPPQYITQCDAAGRFSLFNLAPSVYRLFAVLDRNKNRIYEPGQDGIGLTSADISLVGDSLLVSDRNFRMMKEDTSRLHILQITQTDCRHLRLRFSQSVQPMTATTQAIQLRNREGGEIDLRDWLIDAKNPDTWYLTTAPRDSGEYLLKIFSLLNLFGQPISDTLVTTLISVAQPDTSHPRMEGILPTDSSKMVLPNDPVILQFSESIDTTATGTFYSLFTDSLKLGHLQYSWHNLTELKIRPDSSWQGLTWYRLEIEPAQIRDLAGNPLRSVRQKYTWRTVDPDTLSSISGRIDDEDSTASGAIQLELWQVGEKQPARSIFLPQPGDFLFQNLLPGKYWLQGFRDQDGNSLYSTGRIKPFVPAERFFVEQDTILIRSRWPNEENNFLLKK